MKTTTKNNKLKIFNVLVILILCIGFVNAQQDPYGEKLLKMNQFRTAKSYFLKKIADKPNDTYTYYYLGETYFELKKIDSADFYYQKGLVLNPNDIYCNIGNAKIQLEKGNIDGGKKTLERAHYLSKYKDVKIDALIADALISTTNKQYELAIEYLQKAIELDKTKSIIHIVSGDLNSFKNNIGEAANDYERAIYYDKLCVEAYYKLGKIYFGARNFKESNKAFENALSIDSTYIPAWRDLAEMDYNYGLYQKASEAFMKYIQLTEPDLNDHIRYATILFFNKEYAKSLAETESALVKDPDNFVMKRLKAYNLFETKDYIRSLTAINDYLKTTGEGKKIAMDYEYYGKILSKNSQDSLAIGAYESAINMDSTKVNLYENIGNSYEKLKKFDKAVFNYEKLISYKLNPLSSDYFFLGKSSYFAAGMLTNAADSLIKSQFLQKADTSFSKVAELSPSSYIGFFWKARTNSMIDLNSALASAKPWYEKAIVILENNPEKYKKELLEAYEYICIYYYNVKDFEQAKVFLNKILAIDANYQGDIKTRKELK
ncbi:MAG: tetratricopeptide repeat protein [Bacteroidetes bacterium]|nr:tetratricopeptide repeat protein [Bacteroidota bacterium]